MGYDANFVGYDLWLYSTNMKPVNVFFCNNFSESNKIAT